MVRLAFYLANNPDTHWVDKAIGWWTKSPFSHVELVFSDGMCFSSSPRDGGVRFKKIILLPSRWVIVPLDLSWEEEAKVRHWCAEQIEANKGYDFLGILGFVLRLRTEDERRWFCSEVVTRALQQVFIFPDAVPYKTDPGTLYQLAIGIRWARCPF